MGRGKGIPSSSQVENGTRGDYDWDRLKLRMEQEEIMIGTP